MTKKEIEIEKTLINIHNLIGNVLILNSNLNKVERDRLSVARGLCLSLIKSEKDVFKIWSNYTREAGDFKK